MPAVPLYTHRLADGIAALEVLSCDLVDRRTLEEALGVTKWTAWRILKRCGAHEGPGGALVCPRSELVTRLRRLVQDPHWAPEVARRQRVEQYLDGMLRFASRKHTEIARDAAAEQLAGTRFDKLPPGVDLERSELRIAFAGTQDFLQKVGAVIFALQNDYERISEFLEGPVSD